MATSRIGIDYLSESQPQKEVTVNDAFDTIDAAIAALSTSNHFTGANNFDGPVGIGTTSPTSRLHISRTAVAINPSNPAYLKVTGVADTAMTAGTEVTDVLLDLSRTLQFATGALATQRAMRVLAPTYAFVGASTITDAATLAISGAPIAGANATITNAYALWVLSGKAHFVGALECESIVAAIMFGGYNVPFNFSNLQFTFTSDANATLTTLQSTAAYIDIMTDAVLTTTRNLIVPLGIGNFWIVRNRNAQAIQIIGPSGTGTTVASGKMAVLIGSGANIIRVSPDTTP